VGARSVRGVSLVELAVVVAVVSVLASMALPTWQQQLAKSRRAEAITALTQLQHAQEGYRAHHGSYALQLAALRGAPSAVAHYEIALVAPHGSGYIARATARSRLPLDGGCGELTLSVADGQAAWGPSDHCWNR
jgi:type IV pilus assembly protein PilE